MDVDGCQMTVRCEGWTFWKKTRCKLEKVFCHRNGGKKSAPPKNMMFFFLIVINSSLPSGKLTWQWNILLVFSIGKNFFQYTFRWFIFQPAMLVSSQLLFGHAFRAMGGGTVGAWATEEGWMSQRTCAWIYFVGKNRVLGGSSHLVSG